MNNDERTRELGTYVMALWPYDPDMITTRSIHRQGDEWTVRVGTDRRKSVAKSKVSLAEAARAAIQKLAEVTEQETSPTQDAREEV